MSTVTDKLVRNAEDKKICTHVLFMPIKVYVSPVRMRKTPAMARAGVIFGCNGSASRLVSLPLLAKPDGVESGPLMVDVTDGIALLLVRLLPFDEEPREAASLTSAVGFSNSGLESDWEPAVDGSRVVKGSFDVDAKGASIAVFERAGVVVTPFSCRRATWVGSISALSA